MKPLRIAHLSDPHFSKINFSPTQFFSKQWLGNLNLIFNRQRTYQTEHLWNIPKLVSKLKVDYVVITGDFATTSREEEYREGARFVAAFEQPVLYLPGNHDCYTREAELAQGFYRYFPDPEMQKTRVTKKALGNGWWWIGLDCAIATSILCSNGAFLPEMDDLLRHHLQSIPPDEGIILGNHFPLFGTGRPRHDLARHDELQAIIQGFPQIKLYLHGHDHHPYQVEKEGFPHVLNAGSCSYRPDGSFNLIEVDAKRCVLKTYECNEIGEWLHRDPLANCFIGNF